MPGANMTDSFCGHRNGTRKSKSPEDQGGQRDFAEGMQRFQFIEPIASPRTLVGIGIKGKSVCDIPATESAGCDGLRELKRRCAYLLIGKLTM